MLNTGLPPALRRPHPENENLKIPLEKIDEEGWELSTFLCCVCKCRDNYTKDANCFCGCCPIKLGVIWQGYFLALAGLLMCVDTLYMFQNEYLPRGFPLVLLCI